MREVRGDLWTFGEFDARAVTTNGYVKGNGALTMGGGCALEAAQLFPGIDIEIGRRVRDHGNVPHVFEVDADFMLVTYPTKPARTDDGRPGWMAKSDPELVIHGAQMISVLASAFGWNSVLLPRPGCGLGGLEWDEVKENIGPILDDRFTVISNV